MKTKRNALIFEGLLLCSILLFAAACMALIMNLVEKYHEDHERCMRLARTPTAVAQCR